MSTLVGAFIKAIRRLVGRKNDTDAEHVSSLAVAVVPDCPSSTSSLGDVFDQDDDEEPLQALPSSVLSSVEPTTDHKVTSTTSSLYSSDSGGEEPDDSPTPPSPLPPLSTTSAVTAVTADVVLPVTSGGSSSPRRETAEEEEGGERVGGSVPDMAAPGPGPGPGADPSPPRDVVLLREIIEVVDISSDEDSDDDVQLIEVEPRPNAAPAPAQAAAIAVPVKIEQPLPQHPPALASAQSLDDNPLQRPVFLPTPPLDESPASGPSTDSVIVKSEIMGGGGTAELSSASGAVNITTDPLHVIITIPPKYASSYTHPMHVLQTQESSRATTAAAPTPPPQWRRVVPRAEANSSQHPATTVISADDDDGDDLIILEDESTFGGQGHVGQSTMLVTMTDGTSASLPLSPPQSAEEGAASVPMEVESRATMKSNSLPPPQDEGQEVNQRMDVDAPPSEEVVPNAAHINHNEHQTPPQLSSSPISETFSTVGLMREVPKSIAASEQVKEPQGPVTSKSIAAVPVQEDGNADQVERRPPAAASAPSPSGHRFCPFDNKVSNSPTSIYCSEQCLIGHVEDVLAGYTGKGTVWLFHCTTEEMVQQPKENVVNWLLENRLFSVYKPSSKMSSKLPSGKDKDNKKSRTMEAANGSNGLLVDHQNHQVAGPSRGRGEGVGSSYISDLENLATVRRGRGRPRKKPLPPPAATSTSPIVEPQEEHLSPIKSLGGASNKKRTSRRVESSSSSSSDSNSSSEAEETEDSEDSDDSNDSEDSEDSEQEIIRPIRNEDRKLRLQRRQRRLSRQSNMVEEEDEPEAISMPLARRSRNRPTKSLTTTIASRHQNGSAGSSENDVPRSLPAISRKQLPGGSRRESDQQKSLPPPPPLLQRNHYDHRPAIHPASEKPGKKWNPSLPGYKIGKLSQNGQGGGTPKSPATVSPTSQPLFVRPNSKAVTSCSESRSQMSNGDHAGPSSSGGPSSKSFPKLHLPDIGHLDKADIDGRVSCANSIRDALMNRVPELPPQSTTATTSPPPTLEQVNQLCIAIDAATWKHQANLKAYYMKMRSLLSNIKDASNPDFFVRILRQQVTPAELAKMESRDMASEARKAADRAVQAKTLSMWTQAAEEEVEEAKRRGIRMKKTHKGEREIALDSEDVVSTPDDYITKRDVVTVMDKANNATARRVTVPVTSAEATLAAAASVTASTSNSTSPVVETSPSTPPEEVAASDPNAPISPTGSALSPEDMDIDMGDSPSPPAALSLPPTPISSPSPVGRPIPVRTTTSTSGEKRPAPLGAHPHEPLAKRPSLTEESPLSPEPMVPSALASSTSVFKRSTSMASSSKPYYNGSVGMSISAPRRFSLTEDPHLLASSAKSRPPPPIIPCLEMDRNGMHPDPRNETTVLGRPFVPAELRSTLMVPPARSLQNPQVFPFSLLPLPPPLPPLSSPPPPVQSSLPLLLQTSSIAVSAPEPSGDVPIPEPEPEIGVDFVDSILEESLNLGDPGPSRVVSSTPNSVVSSFSNSKLAPLAKLSISLNISKQAPLTSKAASIFCGPLSSSSDSSSSPSPQKKKAPVGAFPAQPHTPTSANQQQQQSWSCRPFYMDTNTYSLYRYGVKQCGVAAWGGSLTCTMADFKRTEFTVAATKLYGDWGEVGCYFKDSAIKNCLQVPLRGKWNEIWSSIRSNGTKPEHFAIMRLTPKPTPGDITSYNVLQEFLQHKDRLGTCTLERDGELRFLFILPLGGDQKLPEELIDFVGQDLPPPKDRPHLMLTLMCRKRKQNRGPSSTRFVSSSSCISTTAITPTTSSLLDGDATTSCHGISPTFSPPYSPPFRSPRPPPPPPASAAFSAYGRPSVPFANGGGFYPTNRFPGTLVAPIRPLQPAPPSPYFQRPGGAPSGPGPNLLRPNAPPTNYSQCYPAFPYPHAPPPRFRSRFVPPPNSQVVSCSSSSFPRSTTPLVASVPPQPYQPGGSNGSVTSWTSQGPPRSSMQSGARQSLPPPPTPTPSPTLSATSSVNDPMADISKEFQEMLFDSEDELPMEMSKSIELVNKTTNQIIHQSVSASGGETGSSGRSGSSAKTGSMSSSGQHQQKSFASPPPSASYPHSSPSSTMAFQNGSQQLHRSPVGPPQSMQQQSPPPNTAVPIIRDPRLERNHQGRPGSGPFGTR